MSTERMEPEDPSTTMLNILASLPPSLLTDLPPPLAGPAELLHTISSSNGNPINSSTPHKANQVTNGHADNDNSSTSLADTSTPKVQTFKHYFAPTSPASKDTAHNTNKQKSPATSPPMRSDIELERENVTLRRANDFLMRRVREAEEMSNSSSSTSHIASSTIEHNTSTSSPKSPDQENVALRRENKVLMRRVREVERMVGVRQEEREEAERVMRFKEIMEEREDRGKG